MRELTLLLAYIGALTLPAAAAHAQTPDGIADFSGLYRPGGLEVQPCGANEWMRRSFDTDTFCNGSDAGFPFKPEGLERWKAFSPIDDPVLQCVEDFPRNAMRGRPMKITLGESLTEIAYWFDNQWFVRTVHMDGKPPPAGTPHTVTGYSWGRWSGDSLIVETTHTRGGPMFNDHKPNSPSAHFTERYWRAPDGRNLLMDITLDDPEIYTKPFLLNRQEWIAAKFDDTAGRLRDMLVYDAAGGATLYLEFKKGELWEAPLALYEKHTSCPGAAPYDPERQPGKETLLCNTLTAAELAAATAEFGEKVLILRGR